MRYHNFDLSILDQVDGGYPLRGSSETQGEERGRLAFDLALEIGELLACAERDDTKDELLRSLGSALYDALFSGANGGLGALLESAWTSALDEKDGGLRIRLRIEPAAVAALPWEFLYSARRGGFLATRIDTALVRYIELAQPIRALHCAFPLKMLVAIPSSPDLDATGEKRNIVSALEGLQGRVDAHFLEGDVSYGTLSDALLVDRYHVFHFIGHGAFRDDQAGLRLNAPNGREDWVDPARFTSLFQNHPTMKLAVLNACNAGQVSSTQPLLGMAPQLVRRGLPAVVAMQYAVFDEMAVLFARELYRSLFQGWERGQVEIAIANARNRIEGEHPGRRYFGAPVLFLRAPEGLLFDVVEPGLASRVPLSLRETQRQIAAAATHQRNLELTDSDAPEDAAQRREDTQALRAIRARLRLARGVASIALASGLFALLLSFVGAFDLVGADTRLESLSLWVGDLLAPTGFSDAITIVSVRARARNAEGETFGPSWRKSHAVLLENLSQARASVVAFDFIFEEETDFDEELARAIKDARNRGTAVVVAAHDLGDDGKPRISPIILSALEAPAAQVGTDSATMPGVGAWASACVGQRLGLVSLAPLALRSQRAGKVLPGFGLQVVAAHANLPLLDIDGTDVELRNLAGQEARRIPISRFEKVSSPSVDCPMAVEGDVIAERILDLTPLDALRAPVRRYAYEEMLRTPGLDAMKGQIVVVGQETVEDEQEVSRGARESRWGFEIQADAVSTLLQSVYIRPLGGRTELAIMLALAACAAAVRLGFSRRRRGARVVCALTILLLYLGVASYASVRHHVLFPVGYHLFAIVFSYFASGALESRWSLWADARTSPPTGIARSDA